MCVIRDYPVRSIYLTITIPTTSYLITHMLWILSRMCRTFSNPVTISFFFASLNQLRSCVLSDFIIWHFLKRILSPSIPVKVSRIVTSYCTFQKECCHLVIPVWVSPDCKFFLSMYNTKPSNIPPPPHSTVNWDSHDKMIIWLSPCQSETQYHEKGKVSAKHVT